jgi:8-oxo-dGTP diphosphatase
MATGNFRVAVKAFIVDGEERLLILKRAPGDPQRPGIWELPGGRLEPAEDPLLGVTREISEEAGLRIEVVAPLNVHHFTRDDGQTITMITFLSKPISKEVRLSDEHTDYEWIPIKDARSKLTDFFHADLERYERFFADR